LDAAIAFFSLLPKLGSVDEVLCFLRFACRWDDGPGSGQRAPQPSMSLAFSDEVTLGSCLAGS
jgi:hypothetical protein